MGQKTKFRPDFQSQLPLKHSGFEIKQHIGNLTHALRADVGLPNRLYTVMSIILSVLDISPIASLRFTWRQKVRHLTSIFEFGALCFRKATYRKPKVTFGEPHMTSLYPSKCSVDGFAQIWKLQAAKLPLKSSPGKVLDLPTQAM